MLQVFPGKSREIERIVEKDGGLFLYSEAGTIRLLPQTESIVRVSFAEGMDFSPEQGKEIADLFGRCGWEWEEGPEEIRVRTSRLVLRVCLRTGSLRFERPDGFLLLAEAGQESKILDGFDTWRTVENENTQVEEVKTADGIKRRIRSADRVFDRRLYHTRLSWRFEKDEILYGLGQAEEGVWNLRHTTQYLHQANRKIAVPMLVSDRGYGILLSTQSPAIFSDTQYGSYFYTEADEYLDYFFLAGESMAEITAGYRQLTGKASMLPKWAFGYIQSQERYEDEKEILDTAARFREEGIGLDGIVLDWMSWEGELWGQKTFDKSRFPDPDRMTQRLHEMGVHFMISIWPNMSEACENYLEFKEKGMLLPGNPIYDAFREDARSVYWQQAERGLFCHGTDAWWCDSSEPLTPEWSRQCRPVPEEMYREYVEAAQTCMPADRSNAYGYYHAMGIYEGQRGSGSDKRVVNLTRNGYTGSQKYGAILWSGDISASWETLKRQIASGLHFCASGLPYWTLDIGAFFVKKGAPWYWDGAYEKGTEDAGYRELYVRWFQYGAFLPVFRSHGTDCRREPWNFGGKESPFYQALLSAIRLRYRLMPYIYSLAGQTWHDDGSPMRPLVWEFPQDKRAAGIMDQYMFGPFLMVCPVTEPMYYHAGSEPITDVSKSREVWLPEGTDWYDMRTNARYRGGQRIRAAADMDSIPVFVRAGAVLPVYGEERSGEAAEALRQAGPDGGHEAEPGLCTAALDGCPICLRIYPGADGSFTLYEDAGDGYAYEQGAYCLTHITYTEADHRVTWHSEGDTTFRRGALSVAWIGEDAAE